jgi:hypothetical protein
MVFIQPDVIGLDGARLPKELAFGIVALLGGTLLLAKRRVRSFPTLDELVAAYVVLSVASAMLRATNPALAMRFLLPTVSRALAVVALGQVNSRRAADGVARSHGERRPLEVHARPHQFKL